MYSEEVAKLGGEFSGTSTDHPAQQARVEAIWQAAVRREVPGALENRKTGQLALGNEVTQIPRA